MSWMEFLAHVAVLTGIVILRQIVKKTHTCTHETQALAQDTLFTADDTNKVIQTLDHRFMALENEIRLQKSDSSRLIEWLDKRDRELLEIQAKFGKHIQLEEREALLLARSNKIVELGESLRLLRK